MILVELDVCNCKGRTCICSFVWVFIELLYCSRRQWVREEDLAKDLKLHTKQLRRILRFFEEEKIITRDHRREVIVWFYPLIGGIL